jgi:hypothetical protein
LDWRLDYRLLGVGIASGCTSALLYFATVRRRAET